MWGLHHGNPGSMVLTFPSSYGLGNGAVGGLI